MERCTPNSYVTPLNQRIWFGSKRRASQYQIDDHASSSLKAIFHCGRFARAGGATNFDHVKNQPRGHVKKVECSSTFMACPRAFRRTKNAQVRHLQRKLSNVRSTRADKATAMKNCLNVLRYYLRSAVQQISICLLILIRIHSIYIINTYIPLMDRVKVWSWLRS